MCDASHRAQTAASAGRSWFSLSPRLPPFLEKSEERCELSLQSEARRAPSFGHPRDVANETKMRLLALLVALSRADALRCAPSLQPSALRTVSPARTAPPVALSPRTIAGGSGTALVIGLVARAWQSNAAATRRSEAQATEMAAVKSKEAEDAAAALVQAADRAVMAANNAALAKRAAEAAVAQAAEAVAREASDAVARNEADAVARDAAVAAAKVASTDPDPKPSPNPNPILSPSPEPSRSLNPNPSPNPRPDPDPNPNLNPNPSSP